jgi:hypothetical protein
LLAANWAREGGPVAGPKSGDGASQSDPAKKLLSFKEAMKPDQKPSPNPDLVRFPFIYYAEQALSDRGALHKEASDETKQTGGNKQRK